MIPLLKEYREKYSSMPLFLRGDSGFAAPKLYSACEDNDCKYAIRLKQNATLIRYAADQTRPFTGRPGTTRSTTPSNTANSNIRPAAGHIREGWSSRSKSRITR